MSTHGDVYSFGITLLEIFSGKPPTNDAFRDGLTLPEFVGTAFPDEIEQVLDPALLPVKVFDEGALVSVRDCLVSAIRVGLCCTRRVPYERLSMRDAATELRAIRDACARACGESQALV